MHTPQLFLLLSSYFIAHEATARDVCASYSWSQAQFDTVCALGTAPSPLACLMAQQCGGAAAQPLAASICSLDRLFLNLCSEQPDVAPCVT